MTQILQGTNQSPNSILHEGKRINNIDSSFWQKAYEIVSDDMSIDEDDPDFLDAVYSLYISFVNEDSAYE